MTDKKCSECGRKMTQQFIGLLHCKCGISWMSDMGYFHRTPDMTFCLQRKRVGKRFKQTPVIKYLKNEEI